MALKREDGLGDPLPRGFLLDASWAGVGGVLKQRPEDFLVDELPLYEPCGEGEHLYLRVQKTNVSHAELMASVRKAFKVTDRQIGYAGMKDKHAVTQQTISVHVLKDPPSLELGHERMAVLWSARHRNKLRTGHLVGNRFAIRLREVDPLKAPLVLMQLRELERRGVPNYFGPQRFGYRKNNHVIGAMILTEDWSGALAELLGTTGSAYPEYQQERRALFDEGRYDEARTHWAGADRAEQSALKALGQGASAKQACLRLGRSMLPFYINSFQSAAFNRLLDRRLEAGTLETLEEGDLAWKHDSRSVFAVTEEEVAGDALAKRLKALEISPSGALWGSGMTNAAGRVGQIERETLEAFGVPLETYLNSRDCPRGARRPMREKLGQSDLDSGIDEHGPYIRIAFDLARGVYATVALREIMKTELEEIARDGGM